MSIRIYHTTDIEKVAAEIVASPVYRTTSWTDEEIISATTDAKFALYLERNGQNIAVFPCKINDNEVIISLAFTLVPGKNAMEIFFTALPQHDIAEKRVYLKCPERENMNWLREPAEKNGFIKSNYPDVLVRNVY